MTKRANNKQSKKVVSVATVTKMIQKSRIANAELKSFNIAQVAINPTTTGSVFNITRSIVLGDASNQRDGSQINATTIHFRCNTRTATTASVRYIMFSDRLNTGNDPSVGDVLQTTTYNSNYQNIIQNEQKRFHIIFDKTIDLSTSGKANETWMSTHSNFPHKITYYQNTDVNGAAGRNAIYLIVIGSNIIPFVDYDCTVRFLDQ